jgi:hypothetical protein
MHTLHYHKHNNKQLMVSQRYYDFRSDDPLDLGESLWLTSHIVTRGRKLIDTILKVSCAYVLHKSVNIAFFMKRLQYTS